MNCERCGAEEFLPFTCSYCKNTYCVEHHLPENHECHNIEIMKNFNKQNNNWFSSKYSNHSEDGYSTIEKFYFSRDEIKDLLIGMVLVTLVGISIFRNNIFSNPPWAIILLAIILMSSFLLHEIAHKSIAIKNHLKAEFRINSFGAILTLISVISPLKIIAPGAVMIHGATDKTTLGRIALAGPLTNIAIAVIFITISLATNPTNTLYSIIRTSVALNGLLAAFNLLPFGMLDGKKVISWDKKIWAIIFLSALFLFFFSNRIV